MKRERWVDSLAPSMPDWENEFPPPAQATMQKHALYWLVIALQEAQTDDLAGMRASLAKAGGCVVAWRRTRTEQGERIDLTPLQSAAPVEQQVAACIRILAYPHVPVKNLRLAEAYLRTIWQRKGRRW